MDQLTEREQKDLDLQKQPNNKVDVYFVRHAESCSNAISIASSAGYSKINHPPLSYKGIQEAINLGINNEIIDKDFDKYYCSPSLRTIMTACLALRSKSRKKKITLILNPYLIEIKNQASILEYPVDGHVEVYDRQNAFVPKQNLMNMINYIKLWFDNKYIDNYIDYEFVYLMYDLVFLLYFQKKLIQDLVILIQKLLHKNEKNRKQLLIKFILLIHSTIDTETYSKCINRIDFLNKDKKNFDQYNIYKNILFFIDNLTFSLEHNTPAVLKNIKIIIYQEQNTEKTSIKKIIEQLTLLTQDNLFMNNIEIDYSYKDNHEHNADIQKFITNEISPLKRDEKNYNILCFTHGATLLNRFTLNPKLNNTEIIRYDANNDNNERIFNNNIIIDEELLKDIDICGDIRPQFIKRLPTLSSNEDKMFKVIDNYFQLPEYKITTDNNIIEGFKVDILNENAEIAARSAESKAKEVENLKKEVDSAFEILENIKAKAKKAREELNKTKTTYDNAVHYSLTFNNKMATYSAEKDLLAAQEKTSILFQEEEAAFIAYNALVEDAQKAADAAKRATEIATIEEQKAIKKQNDKNEANKDDYELVFMEEELYKNKYLKYKQKYFNLKKNKQLNF